MAHVCHSPPHTRQAAKSAAVAATMSVTNPDAEASAAVTALAKLEPSKNNDKDSKCLEVGTMWHEPDLGRVVVSGFSDSSLGELEAVYKEQIEAGIVNILPLKQARRNLCLVYGKLEAMIVDPKSFRGQVRETILTLSKSKMEFLCVCEATLAPLIHDTESETLIKWRDNLIKQVDSLLLRAGRGGMDLRGNLLMPDREKEDDRESILESVSSKRSGSSRGSYNSRCSLRLDKAKLRVHEIAIQRRRELEDKRAQEELVLENKRKELKREEEELELFLRRLDIEEQEKELREIEKEEVLQRNLPETAETRLPLNQTRVSGNMASGEALNTLMEMSNGVMSLARSGRLPPIQLTVFSGDDLEEYIPFKLAFEESVSLFCSNDRQRYQYLLSYTGGKARKLVSSCFHPNSSVAFKQAMGALEEMYGDKFKLSQQFINQLKSWPAIRTTGDAQPLQDLYIFLKRIHNMRNDSREFEQLDQYSEMVSIVEKFPSYMAIAWRKIVQNKHDRGERAYFVDLMKFVGSQAKEQSIPFFGQIKRNVDTEGSGRRVLSTQSKVSELKNESVAESWDRGTVTPRVARLCFFCEREGHSLVDCIGFVNLAHDEKISILSNRRLCFRCCRVGHGSRDCKVKLECRLCHSNRHITAMHRNQPPVETGQGSSGPGDTRILAIGSGRGNVFSPTVALRVRYKGGPWVRTYAALDAWADGSFISRELSDTLGATGELHTICLSTMGGRSKLMAPLIGQLEVAPLDGGDVYNLKPLHEMKIWPFSREDSPRGSDVSKFDHLRDLPIGSVDSGVNLLLGSNEPDLLRVERSVSGPAGSPFASLYKLGWALCGPSETVSEEVSKCFRVEGTIEEGLEQLYRQEFIDSEAGVVAPSLEDKLWLRLVENGLSRRSDGKYEIPLPFRDERISMPDNRSQAMASLYKLGRSLKGNGSLRCDYTKFVQGLIEKGHLELVPSSELETDPGLKWYLVHHAVYHKVKGKIRVVFDCSRRSAGVSLNDKLLSGPDLLNKLVGVLMRFREGRIALAGDIEQMFLQIKVPSKHSDFMRIFWWPNGIIEGDPVEYRLTSHTFGAVSSPSIANYAVKRVAREIELSKSAQNTLEKDAYMDDVMSSVNSEEEAVRLLQELRGSLASVGFNLVGIISNSKTVMNSVPRDTWNKEFRDIDLERDFSPADRVLGVLWLTSEDCFSYSLRIPDKPCTRRGMLSIVGGIFDPLGFVSPIVVPVRTLFQETCRLQLGWDELLPAGVNNSWQSWLRDIESLASYRVPRCISNDLVDVVHRELHIFCDGSETAYAAVAYIRCVSSDGKVVCSLLMSKTRQVPIKGGALTTIPRIELNAAKLAVSVMLILNRESNIVFDAKFFWSDSSTVLHYLRSRSTRFQRFVENRISFISEHTNVKAWHYIPGRDNIADIASRGISVSKFVSRDDWVSGPKFLRRREVAVFEEPQQDNQVFEVRKAAFVSRRDVAEAAFDQLLCSSSRWQVVCFRIAVFLSLLTGLKEKIWNKIPFGPDILNVARLKIWGYVQRIYYPEQLEVLRRGGTLQGRDLLVRLSPFLDESGVMRVGGRLSYSGLDYGEKHPVVLPGKSEIVQMYIKDVHTRFGHFGRSYLMGLVQENLHVVGISKVVKGIVSSCILCRRLNGRPCSPIMAGLPEARVEPAIKPFHTVGTDFFGPFDLIVGRRKVKFYGVVFTCLGSRAVHLEMADSLTTSSFINSFRRFQARRGRVSVVYSDNGRNLVGGWREMKEIIDSWNLNTLRSEAAAGNFTWIFQPPHASHFGGIFEREIRTTRKVLLAVLREQGYRLTPDGLNTAFCEVEAILNNRPLTPIVAESVECGPLTPNHLLLVKDPEPHDLGSFDGSDTYTRRRWKYVQYIVDIFWERWRKEYRCQLRERQKWVKPNPNLQAGDLVLLAEGNTARSHWPLALVTKVMPSRDGVVRKVEIKLVKSADRGAEGKVAGCTVLVRPVHKLVIVLKSPQLDGK